MPRRYLRECVGALPFLLEGGLSSLVVADSYSAKVNPSWRPESPASVCLFAKSSSFKESILLKVRLRDLPGRTFFVLRNRPPQKGKAMLDKPYIRPAGLTKQGCTHILLA